MRQYTWDEYYDKFYDWATSTQISNLSRLTSLGAADEVAEIIIALQGEGSAAKRLLRKAVEAKLAFSGSDLVEFFSNNDEALATEAFYNSSERLTSKDMEELYGFVEEDDLIKVCAARNLQLPEDLRDEEEPPEEDDDTSDDFEAQPPKLGFFGTIAAILAGADILSGHSQRHRGRCNGDCANCPAHYGYRYGRWYYGHGHTHGCEFGGNKGDGGL